MPTGEKQKKYLSFKHSYSADLILDNYLLDFVRMPTFWSIIVTRLDKSHCTL